MPGRISLLLPLLTLGTLLLQTVPAMAAEPWPATAVADAKLVEVYTAKSFFEGPTWDTKTGKLYFSSLGPTMQILRLDEPGKVTVWFDKDGSINGTYLANDGRLLAAQSETKKILSLEIGESAPPEPKVLYENDKMQKPNDLCQTARGDIYFTSPDYAQWKDSAVYRITPEGQGEKILTDIPLCNGIIASLDGHTLYVADSFEKHWKAYPIADDGSVGTGRVFFNPQTPNKSDPDGMSIDEQGNLYFSGRGGIWVVSPEGKSLGLIPVPEFCSNVTFGGADGKTLYITCADKVYSLAMQARGGQFAAKK